MTIIVPQSYWKTLPRYPRGRPHAVREIAEGQEEHFSDTECSTGMDSRTVPSADQSKAARALLNWSRVRLAAKANLSEMVISDLENEFRKPRPHNLAAIRKAFEDAGIVFTVEGTPSLARSEGDSGLAADNRQWRRREKKA
ncbi:helix-turn-helix transcriptional regulator [Mesorhizobium sp. LNJC384A00]|uniref:helix-turn-helix domain-containing protein n=1 Tax=Mesorhizobium sp. LNJC384A00 TaxID=1287268 RepID=UPI001FDAC071|nr:helix-turn-helix transcriptional regulator [Mesorhizobium sp. LNJC384A00]